MPTVPRYRHQPRRPLALPTDPAAEVRTIAVDLVQLHSRLKPADTPQEVFELVADAHHALTTALAVMRHHRDGVAP